MKQRIIQVFEHQKLKIGNQGFLKEDLEALISLKDRMGYKCFKINQQEVYFKQYVGVIQLNNLCIEILPKVDNGSDEHQWRNVLIQMLKACGHLNIQKTTEAQIAKQQLNLLDIYFEKYLSELGHLIHRGLVKKYHQYGGQVKALKGRLNFAEQIKKNLVHKERFFTDHQVYDVDHLLHYILLKALEVVGHLSRGTKLFDHYRRIALAFPEMSNIKITESMIEQIRFNRKTEIYREAFQIARLILLNYSPDIRGGKEKIFSLLFDMNQLWETFVLKSLQRATRNEKIKVIGQARKGFWGNNFLKPDILIENQETAELFVIDTKWKQASSSPSINDLRQMYAYCAFWNAPKAILLYPGKDRGDSYKPFTDAQRNYACKMSFAHVLDAEGKFNRNFGEEVIHLLKD